MPNNLRPMVLEVVAIRPTFEPIFPSFTHEFMLMNRTTGKSIRLQFKGNMSDFLVAVGDTGVAYLTDRGWN